MKCSGEASPAAAAAGAQEGAADDHADRSSAGHRVLDRGAFVYAVMDKKPSCAEGEDGQIDISNDVDLRQTQADNCRNLCALTSIV